MPGLEDQDTDRPGTTSVWRINLTTQPQLQEKAGGSSVNMELL